MEITLFEFHLDDATIDTPFGIDAGDESAPSQSEEDERSSGLILPLVPLLGVAIVVGLVLLRRMLRSDDVDVEITEPSIGQASTE